MTQMPGSTATAPNAGRSVARPVANLGNTCFANAVLQALAHAPELCLAIDCRPHSLTCPVAIQNAAKMCPSPSASPTEDRPGSAGTRKSRRSLDRNTEEDELEFCALCALEQHIQQVHDTSQPRDKPVAPEAFIKGFVSDVAPWMKIGIQEDSHEFLRLLIDAMQKSCLRARGEKDKGGSKSPDDKEYSFSLFRGLVESCVTCESCHTSSSTVDPMEDIGLEVTSTPSRSDNGVPPSLSDVPSAFSRFARTEELDSNYKCEKCGKVGRATKQSRLKSIPPILTLHLKRFRYGDSRSGADVMLRRSGRSEVKSGSTKIEGHVKFDILFDLKPYLTTEMQEQTKSGLFCRLFAVVVHAGKNSNSGHYIAYVRSLEKNEWWKMDDGRINLVHVNEVLEAEAYMLFYRVLQHSVTLELEKAYQAKVSHAAAEEHDDGVKSNTVKPDEDAATNRSSKRRRVSDYRDGVEWARARTNVPPHFISIMNKIQELIAGEVQLTPEFFRLLTEAASGERSKDKRSTTALPEAVTNVQEPDVVGGTEMIRSRIWDLLHQLVVFYKSKGWAFSLLGGREPREPSLPVITNELVKTSAPVRPKAKAVTTGINVVEPEDANLL